MKKMGKSGSWDTRSASTGISMFTSPSTSGRDQRGSQGCGVPNNGTIGESDRVIWPDPHVSFCCISLRMSCLHRTRPYVKKGSMWVIQHNFEDLILSQEAVRVDLLDPPRIHGKSGLLSAEANTPKKFIIGRNVLFRSSGKLTERPSFGKIRTNNTRPASQRCAPGGFFDLRAGQ